MRHIPLATKGAIFSAIYVSAFLSAAIGAVILASGTLPSQKLNAPTSLDLTGEIPRDEQGYYHGIPGMSGGGASGGWQPGPGDTVRYRLPLGLEILHASPNKEGDFVLELQLRNTGSTPFDVPSSRNITAVEKPENRSRRILFFKVLSLIDGPNAREILGSATTGGSPSIPGSFITLHRGESLRVMLPASSNLIRRSFTKESEKLPVTVTCQEWKLDDDRFFLSGISGELASANRIQFALRGDQIALNPD